VGSSAATAQASPQANFLLSRISPLKGPTGTGAFVALGLVGAVLQLCVCWTSLNLTGPSKMAVTEIFAILVTIGWISFSMAENLDSFLSKGAIIVLLYSPVAGMVITRLGILFWLPLILMIALGVITVLDEVETGHHGLSSYVQYMLPG